MTQRRHHYETAFEEYLRSRRIPYVAVDEAKKALLPPGTPMTVVRTDSDGPVSAALKSFDFVIYGSSANLLLEVKGRRIGRRGPVRVRATSEGPLPDPPRPTGRARLESWVTLDDVESLRAWSTLFGPSFEPAFVFVYWCDEPPPDALFEEIFEHRGRWYALRAILLRDYQSAMKVRSPRWGTVHLSPSSFDRLSSPLAPPAEHAGLRGLFVEPPPVAALDPLR